MARLVKRVPFDYPNGAKGALHTYDNDRTYVIGRIFRAGTNDRTGGVGAYSLDDESDGHRFTADDLADIVVAHAMFTHVNYPHVPGTLYDCPGCENRCNCARMNTDAWGCVYCGALAQEEWDDLIIRDQSENWDQGDE